MQRRIERADHHRESVHGFEQARRNPCAAWAAALASALRRSFSSRARIIACMMRQTIFGEEHVLGAAQADAFGAELPRRFGIARNVGIGAHAELAAELIGPAS